MISIQPACGVAVGLAVGEGLALGSGLALALGCGLGVGPDVGLVVGCSVWLGSALAVGSGLVVGPGHALHDGEGLTGDAAVGDGLGPTGGACCEKMKSTAPARTTRTAERSRAAPAQFAPCDRWLCMPSRCTMEAE